MNMRTNVRNKGLIAFMIALTAGCTPDKYVHGIPNLSNVTPTVWRSGQPTTADDWAYVKSLGVTDVVKLNYESEGTDQGAIDAGLRVHVLSVQPEGIDDEPIQSIPNTTIEPDRATLDEAQTIIASGAVVLVHCTHGSDRTGLAIGRYRHQTQMWSKSEAWKEMLRQGFRPELLGLVQFWIEDP